MSKQRELETKLIVCFGKSCLPPISFSHWEHHTPAILTAFAMDDPLQIPQNMRTKTPRALYSIRTHKKLDPNATYSEQGVSSGDILVLSDNSDPEIVLAMGKVLSDQAGIRVLETPIQETRPKAVLRAAIEAIPYAGKALSVLLLGSKRGE